MEDTEAFVYLLLTLWLFVTHKAKEESQRRLQAARQNTLRKYIRVLEAIQQHEALDERTRAAKRRHGSRLAKSPSVWAFNRASEWWNIVVSSFTNAQWVQNFRMSEETLDFLCNKLRPVMERQDTSFRKCVTLKKRVAIASGSLLLAQSIEAYPFS
ncbi:hypothetical protein N1851_005668 [Merluccius polli]|uniref:Uncharacterized protein n=1 Tax=Merluccius polli TaxID=89951 RepID=A0AA47P916_MERPO|nr:hypothetical protein N1851_005668 [Merluccius polli]